MHHNHKAAAYIVAAAALLGGSLWLKPHDPEAELVGKAVSNITNNAAKGSLACGPIQCAVAVFDRPDPFHPTCVALNIPFGRRYAYILGNRQELEKLPDRDSVLKHPRVSYHTYCY